MGPCGWDVGSMACLQYSIGGAGPNGPCGWDAGSMACLQAQTAAGANCSQGNHAYDRLHVVSEWRLRLQSACSSCTPDPCSRGTARPAPEVPPAP